MVKIQTITHEPASSVVRTPNAQHPFSRAREFQRAYIASKMDKIFAKPFIHSFQGHSDGISALAKCPTALNKFISGAHDGQIRIWDLPQRKSLISIYQHQQSVKGVSFNNQGTKFLSSSADKTINLFDFQKAFEQNPEYQQQDHIYMKKKSPNKLQPLTKYLSKLVLGNVCHSPKENQFVTAGQMVQVWSYQRTKPIYQFQWNVDTIFRVKYNLSDPNLISATGIDRSIILYDLRGQSPIQKIILNNKCPCLAFNPIQPMNLTVGCQDSNCYTFDIRKMNTAKIIHKDHIGAVMDLDYSPTGRQFVTGSFDRTVRIFEYNQGRSREVYHAKRMQIINSVLFTADSHYILSGSQDMNIRLWKAQSSKPSGYINQRQKRGLEYRKKLLQKFGENKKIKRIVMHRHLPKYILNAKKRRQEQVVSKYNKKLNKEANTGVKEQQISEKYKAVEKMEIQEGEQMYERRPRNKKREKKQKIEEQQEIQDYDRQIYQ